MLTGAGASDPLRAALAAGAWRDAHAIAMDRLQRNPGDAPAYGALAAIAEAHGNIAQAAKLHARAESLSAGEAVHGAALARCLLQLSDHGGAREAASRASLRNSGDPETRETLGVVFARLDDHRAAEEHFAFIVSALPARAVAWRNLANARQYIGEIGGAEDAYLRALALDGGDAAAWVALVHLRPQTEEDDRLRVLIDLWAARDADPDRALRIGHAIAKTLEDLGRFDEAMSWLERAKAAKRIAVRHDPASTRRLYSLAGAAAPSGNSGLDAAPVFVVGLPRTGTTLTDRILGCHPDLSSIGESPAMSILVKRLSGSRSSLVLDEDVLARAEGIDPEALGGAYLAAVAAQSVGKRTVDKMPLNFLYARLIHAALPNARIICLRRDPLDTVVANYRQMFAVNFSYYDHCYDLEHLASWYIAFDRLVSELRAVLPADRFCEIGYEGLVADQEGTTRRLLDFVGVAWDPLCLDFHRSCEPVSTASSVQVRQPIHARSVGSWRRHASRLQPAIAVLGEAGLLGAR